MSIMSNLKDSSLDNVLDFLQKKEIATVDEIAKELFISPSSVRRKLTALQEKGLVIRTHGGAKINNNTNIFPTFSFRSKQNSFEKKKIALLALKEIKDGDFIFLDGSTSAFFLAQCLKDYKNIKVMTNGIDTITELSKQNIDAYSTGGKISSSNKSVLVGQNALNTVEHYHANVFIFSAQSMDKDGNIYDCFEEENFVRLQMMKNSAKKVFLIDSSKLNKESISKLCNIKDIDVTICDVDLSEYLSDEYKRKGN